MEMIQTKKWINMQEVDLIAEFANEAMNGNPELNWNKVLEKINRDRAATGAPSLRQRCFVAIMKSGGASDGRIRGWSKRKYLKSVGYKEQSNEDLQKKLQEGIKKLTLVPETEVPQIEKTEVENEPESSAEAEEASKLSNDAIALLKYFVNHNDDRKVNVSAAKKFFKIGIQRIHNAEDELLKLQLLRCDGTSHQKGVRYVLTLDNDTIWQMYPQTKGVCLVSDMTVSRKNSYKNSSEKVEEKKEIEKDSFNPGNKVQDALCMLRHNYENGIPYKDCEDFRVILPNGTWAQFMSIQKILEDLDILTRVGVNGDSWFFQDPEENVSIYNDPKIDKVSQPEIIKDQNVEIIPVPQKEIPKKQRLTEDDADSITVNCYRKDIKYRIMKSSNGYVIDIM